MIITKKLKNAIFSWDDDKQIFNVWVWDKNDNRRIGIDIQKVYAFSLLRFLVRISQRNWYRRKYGHNPKH